MESYVVVIPSVLTRLDLIFLIADQLSGFLHGLTTAIDHLDDLGKSISKMDTNVNLLEVYPDDKTLRFVVKPIVEYPLSYVLLQNALHFCRFADSLI